MISWDHVYAYSYSGHTHIWCEDDVFFCFAISAFNRFWLQFESVERNAAGGVISTGRIERMAPVGKYLPSILNQEN